MSNISVNPNFHFPFESAVANALHPELSMQIATRKCNTGTTIMWRYEIWEEIITDLYWIVME